MKKGMILFPPQWLPVNPYSSAPMLAGQLKQAGYETVCKDSNLEFYDAILNPEYLKETLEVLNAREPMDAEEQAHFVKCVAAIPKALRTLKYGEDFYDIDNYKTAMEAIEQALLLVSYRYPGQKISLNNFYDGRFEWEYKNLLPICSGQLSNIFYDFYAKQIKGFQESGISYICITMPCYTQFVPAFTLAYLLKKHTDIKICLGGNILTRVEPGIRANRDMIGLYCDYIILGDGENAIVRFADFLHGKCKADDVPGLIWKEGRQIFSNPVDKECRMEKVAFPCFDGMDLDGYYSPEPCFAIEFARGCYWGKCSFCAVDISAKEYCMKPMEHFVNEVEYLVKECGICNFVFVDEAIPVKKYVAFADMIIERGLKIHFYSFARLEKQYTQEALKRLKAAGLSILWWGYEASSKRIMGLMNKGIDLDERIPILQRSYDAGIWNHCLCMAGFPGETLEEIAATIAEIHSHRRLFNSCAMSTFFLSYNSAMYLTPEKFGIKSVAIPNDLESRCRYKTSDYTEEEYQKIVKQFRKEYARENEHKLWAQIYDNFDHLLLYLKRYGIEKVRDYDAEENPTF